MGHSVTALVGSLSLLQTAAGSFRHGRVVALSQGYGLIALTEELLDEIAAGEPEAGHDWVTGLTYLSSALASVARRLSAHAPIAYIETDYAGGVGTQSAMLWRDGTELLGPIVSPMHCVDRAASRSAPWKRPFDRFRRRLAHWLGQVAPVPVHELPINHVLRRLGVRRFEALDEFDALGLGRFRHTEDWVDEADGDPARKTQQ